MVLEVVSFPVANHCHFYLLEYTRLQQRSPLDPASGEVPRRFQSQVRTSKPKESVCD
ncbi:MAG: hypothetical protein ACJ71D_08130 [Nitrososphaera sp.]